MRQQFSSFKPRAVAAEKAKKETAAPFKADLRLNDDSKVDLGQLPVNLADLI